MRNKKNWFLRKHGLTNNLKYILEDVEKIYINVD